MDKIEGFIRNSREKGYSDEEIINALKQEGVSNDRIMQAFRNLESSFKPESEEEKDADSGEESSKEEEEPEPVTGRNFPDFWTLWRMQYYALLLSAIISVGFYTIVGFEPALILEKNFILMGSIGLVPPVFVFLTSFYHLYSDRRTEFGISIGTSSVLIAIPVLTAFYVVRPAMQTFQDLGLEAAQTGLGRLALVPYLYNLEIVILVLSVALFAWRYHGRKSLVCPGVFFLVAAALFVTSMTAIQDVRSETTAEFEPPMDEYENELHDPLLRKASISLPPFQRALVGLVAVTNGGRHYVKYRDLVRDSDPPAVNMTSPKQFCGNSDEVIEQEVSNKMKKFYYSWSYLLQRSERNEELIVDSLVNRCNGSSNCSRSRGEIRQAVSEYHELQGERIGKLSDLQAIQMDRNLIVNETCRNPPSRYVGIRLENISCMGGLSITYSDTGTEDTQKPLLIDEIRSTEEVFGLEGRKMELASSTEEGKKLVLGESEIYSNENTWSPEQGTKYQVKIQLLDRRRPVHAYCVGGQEGFARPFNWD